MALPVEPSGCSGNWLTLQLWTKQIRSWVDGLVSDSICPASLTTWVRIIRTLKQKDTHPPGSTCQCSYRGMEVVVTGESQGAPRPANLVSTALKKPVSGRRCLWSPHVGYDMPLPTHSNLFLIHRETQRIFRKWGSEVSITMTTRCPQPISQRKGVFLSFFLYTLRSVCIFAYTFTKFLLELDTWIKFSYMVLFQCWKFYKANSITYYTITTKKKKAKKLACPRSSSS